MKRSYIISEIGNNHNGNPEKALELIDVSAEAGVDAVKFQTFRGIDIVSPRVLADEYKGWDVKGHRYWYEFLDTIALPLQNHQAVIDYTNAKQLHFITTPTSPYIVEFLESLTGIHAYKVASMDLNNVPLLRALAKTSKKILMSTGMGEMEEVKKAAAYFVNHELEILHCVSDYPLEPSKAFLNNIVALKKEFPGKRIGFSDHSLGHELCVAARCLGAELFEKHITLSRKDPNPAEHHFSMEPGEFKNLVSWLRSIDENLDITDFGRSNTEKENKFKYRRSYHYAASLQQGTELGLNNLNFVRPGDGVNEEELMLLIGKKLTRGVEAYDPCRKEDFE